MTARQRPTRVPSYRLHRPSGRAVVTLDGRDHYLGEHGSPESRARYDRLIREYLANGRKMPDPRHEGQPYRVGELCRDFLAWAEGEYVLPDGRQSGSVQNARLALRPLVQLYIDVPVADFGPLALKQCRDLLIEQGLARSTINDRVNIMRRAFRWGCENELVPPSVQQGLRAVEGLKQGRSGVREAPGVRPAPEHHIEQALPHMQPVVQAMVQLQLVTAMRPGELVVLRPCDIDMSGDVWLYRPVAHKNSWRGHERVIAIGPRGQAIIRPLLRPGYQERYLFSPRESERARQEERRARRKTPLWTSHMEAQARKRRDDPQRRPGERYSTMSYARAVRRACEAAEIPVWTPGQLRHNAATRARKELGLEAASAYLGHRIVETTQIYSDVREAQAKDVARRLG